MDIPPGMLEKAGGMPGVEEMQAQAQAQAQAQRRADARARAADSWRRMAHLTPEQRQHQLTMQQQAEEQEAVMNSQKVVLVRQDIMSR